MQAQKADMDNRMRLLMTNLDQMIRGLTDLRNLITSRKQSIERTRPRWKGIRERSSDSTERSAN